MPVCTLVDKLTKVALATNSIMPEHICNRLDKLNRDFLWSNDISQRKTHLVNWTQVTQTKKQGGLGIRVARANNEAMLSKVVWKTLGGEKTIWMDLIQAKYLKGRSVLHYVSKPVDSPMWKGVSRCAQKLQTCFRWLV